MFANASIDYDRYYASLAASSAAASAQATPSGLSIPGSSDFDDIAFEEEEDRKPTVEYLDSLNDYRKRSRSREDEGSAKTKVAKLSAGLNGYDYSPEGGIIQAEENAVMVNDVVPPPSNDDPVVYGMCFK